MQDLDAEVQIVEQSEEHRSVRRDSDEIIFLEDDLNVERLSNKSDKYPVATTSDSSTVRLSENFKRTRKASDDVVVVSLSPGSSRATIENLKKRKTGGDPISLVSHKMNANQIVLDINDESEDEVEIIGDKILGANGSSDHFNDQKEVKRSQYVLKSENLLENKEVLQCIPEKKYISGETINCYLQFLHQKLPEEQKSSVHIYLTFFYVKLKRSKKLGTSDNFKWNRDVDIFSKTLVIFPICENFHWFLVVVCNPGLILSRCPSIGQSNGSEQQSLKPSILVFCSLGLKHYDAVSTVREYLGSELQIKNNSDISFDADDLPTLHPVVPRQPNGYDCGIYLLHYAELIFQDPSPFLGANIPDLSHWFDFDDVRGKRDQIKCQILENGSPTKNTLST